MPVKTDQLDLSKRFSSEALVIVANAQAKADELKHVEIEPVHLLSALLEREDVREVFVACGANAEKAQQKAIASIKEIPSDAKHPSNNGKAMMALLMRADKEARKESGLPINAAKVDDEYSTGVANLLNALSHEIRGRAGEILQDFDLGPGSFRAHANLIREDGSVVVEVAASPETGKSNQHYTKNLIALAKKGKFDATIGRDEEIRRTLQILTRRIKHHALLVGEVGVGKYAIVSEIATRLGNGDVPEHLKKFALLELNTSALLAGAKLRGDEIDKRLNAVFKIIRESEKETILFVRGAEQLADQPSGNLLKMLVAKDGLRLIASTTPDGLRKMNEKDAVAEDFTVVNVEPATVEEATQILRGLAPRYEKHHRLIIGEEPIAAAVRLAKRYIQDKALPEPAIDLLDEAAARKRMELDGTPASIEYGVRRLDSLRAQLDSLQNDEDDHSVKAVKKLEKEIAELEPEVEAKQTAFERHRGVVQTYKHLVAEYGRLEHALDEARARKDYARVGVLEHDQLPSLKRRLDAANAAMQEVAEKPSRVLTENDVASVLEDRTGIPCKSMLESEIEKLKHLEASLGCSVVGQDEAIAAVSQAVRRARLGLRDPRRPVGSFLFLGSSGVGKTLIAKTLTQELFGSPDAMLRMDMSEYKEQHQAQKLIGSPNGYVGSSDGGLLTNYVRQHPNSLLLFDEIEKSSTAVKDLLLGVLDDSRLTDGRGQTSDFSNCIIVLTSNIGTKRLLDADPKMFDTEEGRKELADTLLHNDLASEMRPEFINRIDNVIVFRPLLKDTLLKVADIELRQLDKLLEHRELTVRVSDVAKQALVDDEFNASFGARPLRRAITKHLQSPLTDVLMRGGYSAGDVIAVDYVNGKFTFDKAR